MPTLSFPDVLAPLAPALRAAARMCLRVQAAPGFGGRAKADRSPVTVADFAAQALICRALAARHPGEAVVAEESAAALAALDPAVRAGVLTAVQSEAPEAADEALPAWIDHGRTQRPGPEAFWTIDPVDGTKGFLRGGQFALAVARIEAGAVTAGLLACPAYAADGVQGWLYGATAGGGAWRTPLFEQAPLAPVRVSAPAPGQAARPTESHEAGHSAHDLGAAVARRLGAHAAPLRMDSQVKYAAVAEGACDYYLRYPAQAQYIENIWDHAAGALLVAEAGGCVTDVWGKPLDFGRGAHLSANHGVVATNGAWHAAVLAAVGEALARHH